MTALCAGALADIGARVPVPAYNREQVTTGIVHFGVGGFHRAHEAMYVDALLSSGGAPSWGITGVGVLAHDRRMQEMMHAQDCLYTMVVKNADGSIAPRVIGSVVGYLFAPDDPEAVLRLMTDPATRIVSLTITEGGYHVNQTTGSFDDSDPAIRADIEAEQPPTTVFGFIVEALTRRRAAGIAPFTVMSCDNIQGNGNVARDMISAFATHRDRALGWWINHEVAFPNSMVDRITPVTTDADREQLAVSYAIEDEWPVVCEAFAQWVIEDDFPLGRPAFERVGVQIVDDVAPYELMKLRLLNASHQAMCFLGYLSGYRYVHEVCADPMFNEFLMAYMDLEATPSLEPVPGVDLDVYKRQLLDRFVNPEIKDTLSRLCAEGSDRIPKWLVPVIKHQLAEGGEIGRSALVVAAWARYAEGVDEAGRSIDVIDRRRAQVTERAQRQAVEPLAFLEARDLFDDLIDQPRFTDVYLAALESLHTHGARATVDACRDR